MIQVYPQSTEHVPAETPRVHSISVVIPTRNRPASLARTVAALRVQTCAPREVIIVDASDSPVEPAIAGHLPLPFPIIWLRTPRGVCHQRNVGIQQAGGTHVLLCDDDIEPPADYLQKLLAFLEANPRAGAVTGLVCEPDSTGTFVGAATAPSFRHLFFAFLFQHSVWADVESASARVLAWPLALLKRWYRGRGNTWSRAGWPLFTQLCGPVVRAATYALGAALVRREWLLATPYDERLGDHGIGDNYGVALGFPGDRKSVV